MITVSSLTKRFPSKTVLENVDWHVRPGERVGLVGANGAGKSTLIALIIGQLDADEGRISIQPGARVGHLSQDLLGDQGRSVQAELWTAFAELQTKADELASLAVALEGARDDGELELLVHRQARLTEEFEAMGGYTAEAEIGKVLSGLGFREADRHRLVSSFSGGWQMRVALAKLLLLKPDVLLLDEPTNHLDLEAIEWLEDYLTIYPGSVVLISHDRRFLDRCVTRITELDQGQLTDYSTHYTGYLTEREERRKLQQAAYERQQRELTRQQAFVEKFRASATRSTQAKSREKQLEKIERLSAPTADSSIAFRFPPAPPSGTLVLRAVDLAKRYADHNVFDGLNLNLERGHRLVIVGANGSGKSTLMRLLAQTEAPDTGGVSYGYHVKPAYYSQHQSDHLDPTRTVLDETYYSADGTGEGTWTLERCRSLLARFLFTGEDVFKPVGKLSGGERARLCLAKLMMRPANLLMLDEPTNHLDLASKEVLADALKEFGGTVVLISHDRFLMDEVATHVLVLENGKGTLHLGTYSEVRSTRTAPLPAAPVPKRDSVAEPPAAKKLNPYRRQKAIEELEAEIQVLERRIAELESQLAGPELYQDHVRAAEVTTAHQSARARHEEATLQWVELMDAE